jgi:eukaryotic-like serine/threonine-protein kinase
VGNSQVPDTSDVVDPLWRRVLNDRFTILEPIGSGGMGKVYKAVQAPLDRVVALKVLNPNYANGKDPEFRKRFFLEASLTSRLRHPNTITVIDYGQTPDGIFYIAMEYLEGQTLAQLLAKSGPIRWTRCANICQQICRSLREAHKLGVIHRDLKPANVMLISEDQETDLVKVLDFGLVKSFVSEPDKQRAAPSFPIDSAANGSANLEVTHGGVFLGSPQYMAPEQARNRADQRSDIYSLGTTCYHMLAGRPPFWAKDAVEVIFKHINEPVPPLRSVRPDSDVPPEFEAVLMKCLEKQPSHRFQSMEEVLEALRRVALAAGNSGIFVNGAAAPTGLANTPPPIPTSTIPPPPSLPPPVSRMETTLALDISVDPLPASSPSAIWYRNRTYWYAAAGALLFLVVAVFALSRRGSRSSDPTAKVQAVTKPNPPIDPRPIAERSVEKQAAVTERAPATPKAVKFNVSTEPSGATVSLDGRILGATPLLFEVPGNADGVATAHLLLTMKGYHPMTVTTGGSGEVVLNQKLQARIPGRPPPASLEPKEAAIEKPAITVAVPEPKKPELETKVALAKLVPTFEQPRAPAAAVVEVSPPPPAPTLQPSPELPAPVRAPAPTGPVEFTDAMMPPLKISGPDPEYTQRAIDHESEGTMLVRCIVTVQGLVHSCQALKTVPFMERPVIEALERRRYKPASLHGKPIEVYYTFQITLKLAR